MLVIGHSFVRRLLTPTIAAGITNVGLDYADFTIILHGVSGLKLGQFKKELRPLVSCVQPDLVFSEIGSNDICDGENSSVVCVLTAQRMVDLAIWVVGECNANSVEVIIGRL